MHFKSFVKNHFRDLEIFLVTTFHKRVDEVNRTVTEAGIKLQGVCEQFRSQDEDAKTKMSGIREEFKAKTKEIRDEVEAAMRKEIGEVLLAENQKNDKRVDEVNRTVTEAGIKLQGVCEQFRSQDENAKQKTKEIRDEVEAAMRKEIGELLLAENQKNDNKLGKLKAELKKEEKKQNTELGAVEKEMKWIQKKMEKMEMEKKEDKKKIIELEEEVRWLIARNRKAECDLCGRKCNTAWGLARHIVEKHTSTK